MITDPAIEAQRSRDIFVDKSTILDVQKWQGEIAKFEQDIDKIGNELLATSEKINIEKSKLALLKSEYSLESVVVSATKEVALIKAIQNLEERLEILRNRIPKLEEQIRQREKDVFDVGNNLAVAEITEDFKEWLDREYFPSQEKFLELRRELIGRLQYPHHLKVSERDLLKGVGECQYLLKIRDGLFKVVSTANDPKY